MSRIVIHSFGSLGDLHPYLAVALELKRRGHEVLFATAACYRQYLECRGLTFHPVSPDCDWLNDSQAMRRFSHLRLGLLRLAREMMLPALRQSYDDLLDSHSPTLVLALFSQLLARRQCDWPLHTVTTGFPFYDGGSVELSAELQDFLDGGAPPIVFTLGTAVSSDAGQFFQSNTIMVVEADEDRVVVWTQPDDLIINPEKPLEGLGHLRPNGFLAVFADGHARLIQRSIDLRVLANLFNPLDGQPTPGEIDSP